MDYYYRIIPRIESFDTFFRNDRVVFVTDTYPFSPLWNPGIDYKLEGKDEILLDHEVSSIFPPGSN